MDEVFTKLSEIRELGISIVIVEQNARRALALADRGYVLELGRNRYDGDRERAAPRSESGGALPRRRHPARRQAAPSTPRRDEPQPSADGDHVAGGQRGVGGGFLEAAAVPEASSRQPRKVMILEVVILPPPYPDLEDGRAGSPFWSQSAGPQAPS